MGHTPLEQHLADYLQASGLPAHEANRLKDALECLSGYLDTRKAIETVSQTDADCFVMRHRKHMAPLRAYWWHHIEHGLAATTKNPWRALPPRNQRKRFMREAIN